MPHQDGSEKRDGVVLAGRQLGEGVVNDEADLVHPTRRLQHGHGLPKERLNAHHNAGKGTLMSVERKQWSVVFTPNTNYFSITQQL